MEISCVILCWNSQQHIRKCLSSLLVSLSNEFKQYEIFVVDNGSTDKSKEIIDEFSKSHPQIIKPVFLNSNTGTTYSRNLALKQTTGKLIAIIDSDVVVKPDIFPPLIATLYESERYGMVVPKLVYGDGGYQKSTDEFPTIFTKIRRYFFLKKIETDEGKVNQSSEKQPVDYAISAFWLLKKETVTNVGLLDEKIFYAPEDVDYCLRIWKADYMIIYDPSATVTHNAQETSRGFKINRSLLEHIKGLLYYFVKHGYWYKKPTFPLNKGG